MSEDESDDEDDLDEEAGGSGTGVTPAAAAVNDGGGVASTKKAVHKFMPPIEVELQMQLLWRKECSTLNLLFSSGRDGLMMRNSGVGNGRGRIGSGEGNEATEKNAAKAITAAAAEEGFRLFFVQALAVPPPRFRPPMDMGDFVAEHPQNVYLAKVRKRRRCFLGFAHESLVSRGNFIF